MFLQNTSAAPPHNVFFRHFGIHPHDRILCRHILHPKAGAGDAIGKGRWREGKNRDSFITEVWRGIHGKNLSPGIIKIEVWE